MKSLNSMCSELGMSLGRYFKTILRLTITIFMNVIQLMLYFRRFDIFNIDIGAEIIMPFRQLTN